MEISIYREIKPSHYEGSDIGITVTHKMKDKVEVLGIIAEIEELLRKQHNTVDRYQ